MLIKKITDGSGFVTSTVLNTEITEFENKIPDANGLVTATVLDIKFAKVRTKFQVLVV